MPQGMVRDGRHTAIYSARMDFPSPQLTEPKKEPKMNKSPAFQFYPNDWLSSPSTAIMSPAQEGAYIRLLCYCWQSGDCTIPSNEKTLLQLSRLNNIDDLRVVAKCFNQHPTDDSKLVHDRLILELKKQEKWRAKSSAGGKKSVETKRNFKGGSTIVQPKVNSSSSSSSSNIKNKQKEFPDWLPIQDWNDWINQRKKKPTERAIELAIAELDRLRLLGIPPDSVLQHCIMNGYQGIFPPKQSFAKIVTKQPEKKNVGTL